MSDRVVSGAEASPPGSRSRVAGLDGLRALAVGLVLLEHLPKALLPAPLARFAETISSGYLGVDLFFVLSGFLITRILLADRREGVPIRWFLARRALRILPAFYLLVGTVALLAPGPFPALPYVATYTVNYWAALTGGSAAYLIHTWSLAVEEHFYLLWPLAVAAWAPSLARRWLLAVLVPGCVLLSAWLLFAMGGRMGSHLVEYGTQSRALSLLAGAWLACREAELRGGGARLDRLALGLVLAAPLAAWIATAAFPEAFVFVRYLASALGCTAVVALCVRSDGRTGRLSRGLEAAPLRFLGQRSYGIYLYHLPLFALLGRWLLEAEVRPNGWHALLAVGLTVAVAELSYRLWERPFLRLKGRFSGGRGD
jgi:peptidoglycan/LPS O-acetylase OafA/YrhL